MRIKVLIAQLKGLLEGGEKDVMVAYWDREYWNELEDTKLDKDAWARASEVVDIHEDWSRCQEGLASLLDEHRDEIEGEDA